MKKIMFSLCLLFGAAVAVNAQDSTSVQPQTPPAQDQTQYKTDDQSKMDDQDKDKREISAAQLPASVREQLQSQSYTGWTISKAYEKEKDGAFVYAVELKNGDEIKKVKFDAQGNVLKEKEKKDHDQK